MKKLLSVMLLVMSVMVVYAQETPATDTKAPVDATAPAASSSALKLSDLPKAVTESIAKEYPGYTIKEAMKAKEGSGADFKVVVAKGTTNETLLYDKNGKFIKKGEAKTEKHDAGTMEKETK
jgi:hypothetical protein